MGNAFYWRTSRLTVLVLLLGLPWIVWSVQAALHTTRNAPMRWVSEKFAQRREFDQFVQQFDSHNSIVISWPGCTVDDRRLQRLEQRLRSSERASAGFAYDEVVAHIATGYTAIRQLMAPPLELSRSEAGRRLQGTLVGPELRQSCAIVSLSERGDQIRHASVAAILEVARQETGLRREQIHMAGPVLDGIAIDSESARSNLLAIPSAAISLAVCWLCLRCWRLTGAVFIVAAFGEGLVLALVHAFGLTMNAVFSVMSPLVFVLTVSAGVHLVNYYYDQFQQFRQFQLGPDQAVAGALRAGWVPCLLAALTTALGLGSLLVSDILPVRQFGAISSLGVLLTTGLLFLVVPGAMGAHGRAHAGREETSPTSNHHRIWAFLTRLVSARAGWLALLGVAAILGAGYGLRWTRTSVSVRELLGADSPTLRDYRWLEERIGPLVPVEIVIHFDASSELDLLQRVELLRDVERAATELPRVGGVTSAATFAPRIPEWSLRNVGRRARIRSGLEESLPDLMRGHWLHVQGQRQSWRISTRAPALGNIDYGGFLEQLRRQVEPVLSGQGGQGVSATYTGLTPLVYTAQRALLHDLVVSFLTALGLVTLVMILVQRSLLVGLMAMLPNVFPSAVLFGMMGWMGWMVDIGTVMTASVALGIAVDGTLHFLTWYRRERRAGRERSAAIERTYRHCGVAMMQTTLICGLGLLVFVLSGFVPTRKFALMMVGLLSAALVGDLILLPALLLSPIGHIRALSR